MTSTDAHSKTSANNSTDLHTHGEPDAWCEACNREVPAVRPAFYWKLARAAVWAFIPLMLTGYIIIGMGAIGATVLAPFMLFLGISMLTVVHDEAGRDPSCPRCRRMVISLDEHREARSTTSATKGPRG